MVEAGSQATLGRTAATDHRKHRARLWGTERGEQWGREALELLTGLSPPRSGQPSRWPVFTANVAVPTTPVWLKRTILWNRASTDFITICEGPLSHRHYFSELTTAPGNILIKEHFSEPDANF